MTFQKRYIFINKDIKKLTEAIKKHEIILPFKNYNSIACAIMNVENFEIHKEKKFFEFIDNTLTEISDIVPKYIDPEDGVKFKIPNYNKKLSPIITIKASIEDNFKIFDYIISEYELQNYYIILNEILGDENQQSNINEIKVYLGEKNKEQRLIYSNNGDKISREVIIEEINNGYLKKNRNFISIKNTINNIERQIINLHLSKNKKELDSEKEAVIKEIHIKIAQLIVLGDKEKYKKGEPWETVISIKKQIRN